MKRIAVFPGSFDPITVGHQEIVTRGLSLFDQIIVAVGTNASKSWYFPVEQRLEWIGKVFADQKRVQVSEYNGLTIDFCKASGAQFILRGLRASSDFEFEKGIAQMNASMNPEIQTVFLVSNPAYSGISSTIVRDIIRNGGDASKFVPKGVEL
jgi:pantetheine-phosphate adenylyltransferase